MNYNIRDVRFGDSRRFNRRIYYNILYDFYSPLLTERQRKVYETLYFSDLTPTEGGQALGVTRQAVHEQAQHVIEKLDSFEGRLHCVARINKLEAYIKDLEQENELLREKLAEKEGE